METVAVRVAPVFAATLSVTLPEPAPTPLPETVIQAGKLWTIQAQDEPVWMVTEKLPPDAAGDKAGGVTEAVQEAPEGVKTRMRLLPVSAM